MASNLAWGLHNVYQKNVFKLEKLNTFQILKSSHASHSLSTTF